MAKLTPSIGTTGRYTLRNPYVANPGVVYTCIAIRSFEDIIKRGVDVYETFYVPVGLIDGQVSSGGTPFRFTDETSIKANIITLKGSDGSLIYVPDTYIEKFPNMGEVQYENIVLSVDIGAVPSYLSLSAVMEEVKQTVSARFGTITEVKEHRSPALDPPTNQEHEAAEAARVGNITEFETTRTKLNKAQAELARLKDIQTSLLQVLRDNNLLPRGS